MKALQRKCVVITGSGRGLGAAYARSAAVGGAAVVVNAPPHGATGHGVDRQRDVGSSRRHPDDGDLRSDEGAVASFTYAWAAELVGSGVRCNAISPLGRTRMVDTTRCYLEAKALPMYGGEAPDPEANAPVAVFLLSDRSAGVNGQIVRIEGGQLSIMTHPAVWLPILTRDVWTFDAVADAFATDLVHRQSPTGVFGIRPDLTAAASSFWEIT